jgi:basic amino acid/polyamine antiporter, APA family
VTQPTAVLSHAQPKPLSLWLATALVIGNMIGSGIILLPASLAGYRAWSLVGWGFTAVGAFLLAWVFARLAQAYPKTGGQSQGLR